MYTNELLEEKYKAQRQLSTEAVISKKGYFEFANKEATDLFKYNGWEIQFDKKSGGHIGNAKA